MTQNIEHIFGGGVTFLNLLSDIDTLPHEVSETLHGIVIRNGCYASYFDERRTEELQRLIDEEFLRDVTEPRQILEKKYSRDTLFMELSKRQYDITPKTTTTKQQMVDWILENSEQLTERLTKKYATVCYAEKLKQHINELYDLVRKHGEKHTYRAERVFLTDFYYELENETDNEEENLDVVVGEMMAQYRTQPSKKKKKTALLLCIFGGYFGLHYFYAGKILTGLLYLFTAGIFCIGWLVDIARIATGKFKDKDEHYLK